MVGKIITKIKSYNRPDSITSDEEYIRQSKNVELEVFPFEYKNGFSKEKLILTGVSEKVKETLIKDKQESG